MSTDEATTLLTGLAWDISAWQCAVSKGRSVKTVSARAATLLRKLFLELTGENPTDAQIAHMVARVGLL